MKKNTSELKLLFQNMQYVARNIGVVNLKELTLEEYKVFSRNTCMFMCSMYGIEDLIWQMEEDNENTEREKAGI